MASTSNGVQKAKGQPVIRVATSSGAAVFKFSTSEDRDAFLGKLQPLKDAAMAAAGPRASDLIPSEEAQKEVFKQHKDLKDVHARLVAPGHITELEFWASKQRQIRAVEATVGKGQQVGVPNLLQLVQTQANGKARFVLTKDLERQIFAEYPAVAAAYAATVPNRRTREEFFEEFYKLYQARLTRQRKRAAGTLLAVDEHMSEFEEEVHRYELDLADRKAAAKRRRLAAADPTVNLAADTDGDAYAGHGFRHEPSRENESVRHAGSRAEGIAADLNTRAAVVLAGRGAGQSKAGAAYTVSSNVITTAQERARSELADLRAQEDPRYEPLDISDAHRYYTAQAARGGAAAAAVKEEVNAGDHVAVHASDIDKAADAVGRLADALASPAGEAFQAAMRGNGEPAAEGQLIHGGRDVLFEIHRAAQQDGELDEFGNRKNPATVLLPEMIKGLREHVLGVNELLRHFWRGFPLNTPARKHKMVRIVKALEHLYQQSNALERAGQDQDRVYISQLLRPSMDAMDAAFTKYDGAVE